MVLMEAAISPGPDTVKEDYGKIFKNVLIDFIIGNVWV